jgi:hypothetical protein
LKRAVTRASLESHVHRYGFRNGDPASCAAIQSCTRSTCALGTV